MEEIVFKPWPKIKRHNGLTITITEKMDGTNACIIIENGEVVGCQSRNKIIRVGDDNAGFSSWVENNKQALVETLGDGYHYGEWCGPNIQSNPHKLTRKTFFLFNSFRWGTVALPEGAECVPIIYTGPYSQEEIDNAVKDLKSRAEYAGYKAEGVIVYYHELSTYSKHTILSPEGKWKE